jgi:hypothetical protein
MAEIESSLGKTSSGTGGAGRKRVLTVDDQSTPQPQSFGHNPAYLAESVQRQGEGGGYRRVDPRQAMGPEELKEYEERRAEAVQKQKRISPEAKERIEFLTGLGRIVDSVTVEEIEFTFQSLKGKEQNEVFEALSQFGEMSALRMQYEVRFHTLARALTHIQGRSFEEVIESDDIEDKLEVIRAMDENLSDHLYKWYQKNIIATGQEKYAIKSPEDVKEVTEAIKKS